MSRSSDIAPVTNPSRSAAALNAARAALPSEPTGVGSCGGCIVCSPRLSTRLSGDLCPLTVGHLPLDGLPSADRLIHELGVRRFLFAAVYFQLRNVLLGVSL